VHAFVTSAVRDLERQLPGVAIQLRLFDHGNAVELRFSGQALRLIWERFPADHLKDSSFVRLISGSYRRHCPRSQFSTDEAEID